MKCDELKRYGMADPAIDNEYEMYKVKDVDEAIKELKSTYKESVEVKVKIWERCKKAEDELRKTQRALWLARAEKARFFAIIIDQHTYTQVLHFTSRKRDDSGKPLGIARTAMEWWKMFKEVERKCRAKAKELEEK